jgi:putative thiamine transport system substrate-binding protein
MNKLFLALALGLTLPLGAQAEVPDEWSGVLDQARGQTVYLNAWGGESNINNYIRWAAEQVEARYDIDLVHVKLGDTAEAVSRVVAEKQGGNTEEGAVDLIWINGENFATLKQAGLLFGPWVERLPNFPLTDPENNPAVTTDFTVPVEGLEAPWGKAQVVFYYDQSLTDNPPGSMSELLSWAKKNPGEFSYPKPPQFLGTTFLKQALIELTNDRKALYGPVSDADFETVTAPLWAFLDQLHPHLWRSGRNFPDNGPALRRLMGDGALSLAFSFSPAEVPAAIANNELPPTVESYVLDGGTIGNVSFLAIPFNAQHKAGAMVMANFLLSPEAQAHKQNPENWGSLTVLDMDQLSAQQRAAFEALPSPKGGVTAAELQRVVEEPHASWVEALESAWLKRYSGS